MKRINCLVLFLIFASPVIAFQENISLQRLSTAERFAFGGTGYGGQISQSELDFWVIFSGDGARVSLEEIYKRGNVQAKLYALTGIKQLDTPLFETLASALADSDQSATTMKGCIVDKVPVSDEVKLIKDGHYANYFSDAHQERIRQLITEAMGTTHSR